MELAPPWQTCPRMQPPPLDSQGARWGHGASSEGSLVQVGSPWAGVSLQPGSFNSWFQASRLRAVHRAGPRPCPAPDLWSPGQGAPSPTADQAGAPTSCRGEDVHRPLLFWGWGAVGGGSTLETPLFISPASGFWVSVSTSQP